jgi:hypothetical protein
VYRDDLAGTTRTYVLRWTRITTEAALESFAGMWAWGPTRRASVTLQTCYGPHDSQRLVARFVAVE